MMPKVDGLDVCRVLRAESDVPVLMLTARSTEDDLLLGLDLGADDYMTKPYSPRELMARVRTLLRRTGAAAAADRRAGAEGRATLDGRPGPARGHGWRARRSSARPAEFRILQTLAAEPDRVFTREQLLERSPRLRPVHHRAHRRRARDEPAQEDRARPAQPARLLTVYGVGYKLTHA